MTEFVMQPCNDSVQYVISSLITHSHVMPESVQDIGQLNNHYYLSKLDFSKLSLFIAQYLPRLKAHAAILKKKRREEADLGLSIINQMYLPAVVDGYWQAYIDSYTPRQSIPENPIEDAIKFYQYACQNKLESDVDKEILTYEINKNMALLELGIDSLQIVHPALKIYRYQFNITELIKKLNDKSSMSVVRQFAVKSGETVVYYYNWIKGKLTISRVNQATACTLADIKGLTCLQQAEQKLGNNLIILQKAGIVRSE